MGKSSFFWNNVRSGEAFQTNSRHRRRAENKAIEAEALAEARKAGTGLSIPALKKMIRRKVRRKA